MTTPTRVAFRIDRDPSLPPLSKEVQNRILNKALQCHLKIQKNKEAQQRVQKRQTGSRIFSVASGCLGLTYIFRSYFENREDSSLDFTTGCRYLGLSGMFGISSIYLGSKKSLLASEQEQIKKYGMLLSADLGIGNEKLTITVAPLRA